jgi:hypothetical protein
MPRRETALPGDARLIALVGAIYDAALETPGRLQIGIVLVDRTTVRTHLARVFEKTDTRRQSALVRLFLRGLAQVHR